MVKKRFFELTNIQEEGLLSTESIRNRIKKALEDLKGDLRINVGTIK
jgi:hypothetical protein